MARLMRVVTILFVALFFGATAFGADTDRPGSKDHPLFTRMPGYFISMYRETEFDTHTFVVIQNGKPVRQAVEGHKYVIDYALPRGTANPPSPLQIARNYTNAVRASGGEILNDTHPTDFATMRLTKNGKEVWMQVDRRIGNGYLLTIVEKQAMRQDVLVRADALANDLRATGKVAIYGIYFDTGKSDLKPESEATLAEMGKLLKQNPGLRVFIVGHTDMVGDAAMNTRLSQARAQSVAAALAARHGIPSSRLVAFGAGPYAPVASNRDEEGRARNRRVELVEIATN